MISDYFCPIIKSPQKICELSISSEQYEILFKIKIGLCLKVIAGAGCAKSTTSILIAAQEKRKNHLILTYNRELADESTKMIRDYGLTNIDCKTIHAQVGICASRTCENDIKLIKQIQIWRTGGAVKRLKQYDIIYIDEAQDLRASLYEALTYILPSSAQIVVMGDPKQLLYDYNIEDAATCDYLQHAEKYFSMFSGNRKWSDAKLSQSFRLPPKITRFVNTIWHTNILSSNTSSEDLPVEYWFLNTYGNEFTSRLKPILENNKPEDVIILSQMNMKSSNGKDRPLMLHINSLIEEKTLDGKQKFKFHFKDSSADEKASCKNKIRVFTYCACKGLTVPIVIVFGFDVFRGNITPINQIGTAIARASRRLIVVHCTDRQGKSNPYYPSLNKKTLECLVSDGVVLTPDNIPDDTEIIKPEVKPETLHITSITHLSGMTILRLLGYGEETVIKQNSSSLHIETKRVFNTGLLDTEEEFSAIYNLAIQFALYWNREKKIPDVEKILKCIRISKFENFNLDKIYQLFHIHGIDGNELKSLEHLLKPDKWIKGNDLIYFLKYYQDSCASLTNYGICELELFSKQFPQIYYDKILECYGKEEKSEQDFMILANASLAFKGTHETFAQMGDNYDWINEKVFKNAIDVFENVIPKDCSFQITYSISLNPCAITNEKNYQSISGTLNENSSSVYLLIFSKFINETHKLHALLYSALKSLKDDISIGNAIIVNGRTGEVIQMRVKYADAMKLLYEATAAKLRIK